MTNILTLKNNFEATLTKEATAEFLTEVCSGNWTPENRAEFLEVRESSWDALANLQNMGIALTDDELIRECEEAEARMESRISALYGDAGEYC